MLYLDQRRFEVVGTIKFEGLDLPPSLARPPARPNALDVVLASLGNTM
jgi:hypothetical protein